MKALFMAAVLALALPAVADETKLGAGVTLKEATPIASLLATPEKFVGKTIRIDGVAQNVCSEMGCWIAIAADAKADSPAVRVKVEDGVIVFPMSAKGKAVSAEGVFEAIKADDAHAKEAAGEHAKQDPKASAKYQIKGLGAIIK